jgi:uncharacterized membrane protein YagU involved in acid resistance
MQCRRAAFSSHRHVVQRLPDAACNRDNIDNLTKERPAMPPQIERAFLGALAGCAATLPMTVVMELLHRRLPTSQREPLPPREITMQAVRPTGMTPDLDESERVGLTLASHFAYGAAMGCLYSALIKDALPIKGRGSGVTYGLGVWAASYLGLLPATGLYPSATEQPAERNALMIAAHVVWGASLDFVLNQIEKPEVHEKALRPSVALSIRQQYDGEPERRGDREQEFLDDSVPLKR